MLTPIQSRAADRAAAELGDAIVLLAMRAASTIFHCKEIRYSKNHDSFTDAWEKPTSGSPVMTSAPRRSATMPRYPLRYAILQVLTLGTILYMSLQLWKTDLRVPLDCQGDALVFVALAKALKEGWWLHISNLGLPFGMDLVDWPINMNLDFVIMKAMYLITDEAGRVVNLYWLASVCLTGVLASLSFRILGIPLPIAWVVGSLYALFPYTFYRHTSHLNLVFHFVPVIGTFCILILTGRLADISKSLFIFILAICCAQGLSYIYNSFFGCFFMVVALILGAYIHRDRRTLVRGTAGLLLILALTGASFYPSVAYWAQHGRNQALEYKRPMEADLYGLKLRNLLLPVPQHPVGFLRNLSASVQHSEFPLENENTSTRLGTVGGFGFLLLLGVSLLGAGGRQLFSDRVMGAAAALNLAGLLLAVIGGFGGIFNTFVAADIRCYNRIVIFIGFFSFLATAAALSRGLSRVEQVRHGRIWVGILGALLLVWGAVDQSHVMRFSDNYRLNSAEYWGQRFYLRKLEAFMPAGTWVFQLPHAEFPFNSVPLPNDMDVYDQSRVFLHSNTFGWSWGAIRGRNGDWQLETAKLPTVSFLRRIVNVGFTAVWLDRMGYIDKGAKLVKEIEEISGAPPVQSPDGRYAFFDIREFAGVTVNAVSEELQARRAAQSRYPVLAVWGAGFYPEERFGTKIGRWCNQSGLLELRNPLDMERRISISMVMQTSNPNEEPVEVSATGFQDYVHGDGYPDKKYTRTVTVAPGEKLAIHFKYSGRRVEAPADPRSLYFNMRDFQFDESFE